jgi:FKBP-type peptidyl-prolyl cis-trans isomerase FklB
MKQCIVVVCAVLITAAGLYAANDPALSTQKDKVSYSLGLNIGSALKKQGVDVNAAILMRGINDALSGAKPALSNAEIEQSLTTLQKDVTAKQTAVADKNKTEGESFLAANKTKPGVKTTASGLQYKVLKAGTGPKPKATDKIKAHYRGTFIDGTEFDSSYKRGEPAVFPVNGVIKGWTEAMQLMEVGSKWQLFIPSTLAYGERGAGDVVGPNATLIFEVELLGIEPPAK